MMYYFTKVLISAVLIVAISEISKRSTVSGAVLASIPLVSVLGMIWLFIDTGDSAKVAALAQDIFWLVLPSLALFIVLPLMLKAGINFWGSLTTSIATTVAAYGAMIWTLQQWRSG